MFNPLEKTPSSRDRRGQNGIFKKSSDFLPALFGICSLNEHANTHANTNTHTHTNVHTHTHAHTSLCLGQLSLDKPLSLKIQL